MKQQLKSLFGLILMISAPLALSQSCSTVDEAVDCNQLCTNYETCEDSSFDASECTSVCESRADVSDNFADDVDACQECIDDKACSEQEDACSDVCAGITLPDEDDSSEGNLSEAEACLSVCTNYEECTEGTYDSSSCAAECENLADADPTGFAEDLLDCDDCIDDKACGEQECASCDALNLATLGEDNPGED